MLTILKTLLSFASGVMDMFRTAQDRKAGSDANELRHRNKQDEIRKDADGVWDGPIRGRLRNNKNKG